MPSWSWAYLQEEAVGGLAAGIVGTVIGFPLDTVKTRLQTSHAASEGMLSTARTLVRTEGVLSLYKGLLPPLISLSILNTVNFASYSYFHQLLNGTRNWDLRNALAGGICGPMSSVVSTVENLVKTQMQVDNVGRRQFLGSIDCLRQLTAQHGVAVLYTGHVVNTVRETAFISTYFFMYEGLRHEFLTHGPIQQNHKIIVPLAGGLSGAISWAVSFPLDCVRAGVQGSRMDQRRSAVSVVRELLETKGVRGLYAGVAPSIARAFLVSGSRFSAYEFALWLLRGGRGD